MLNTLASFRFEACFFWVKHTTLKLQNTEQLDVFVADGWKPLQTVSDMRSVAGEQGAAISQLWLLLCLPHTQNRGSDLFRCDE